MTHHYSFFSYLLFSGIILIALLIDLYAHRKDRAISLKNAAIWSLAWVIISLAFAGYLYQAYDSTSASLFLSGYLLEKSLSVDNLFVFIAIFASFGIKGALQHRVLYYGILGAIVLRLIFIALGSSLLKMGHVALMIFALFVLWSAYKMYQASKQGHKEIKDYSKHSVAKFFKRFFPVSNHLAGHAFFITDQNTHRLTMTPLFLCLVMVETADIMFAFDSVPAVIAVTQEPFLVYTSNIFAILGLRSLYFLLAAAQKHLAYLDKAIIGVLFFIGFKLILDLTGVLEIEPILSLIIIFFMLASSILISLIFAPTKKDN